MSTLYPYKFLNHINTDDIEIPLKRYLYKFENHRNEVVHLKQHEKDFLFRALMMLRKGKGEHAYNLFTIPEAQEFLFHWIILTHANQVMIFDGHINGPFGQLSKAEVSRNKQFFYNYLRIWKSQIEKGEGAFLSVIKPSLNVKIKEWRLWAEQDRSRNQFVIRKQVYIYAIYFHIYYCVKLFFDEKPKPYIIQKIGEYDVVFNIYSYVHILSRHYYPNMNRVSRVSLNTELQGVNLDYLPDEIMPLIERSNSNCPITPQTEYLLYELESNYYILWIKYKKLTETGMNGFEVRSFYKCEEQRDLAKAQMPNACVISIC